MTESSAVVLDRLPEKARKAALDDLYGKVSFSEPDGGVGYKGP